MVEQPVLDFLSQFSGKLFQLDKYIYLEEKEYTHSKFKRSFLMKQFPALSSRGIEDFFDVLLPKVPEKKVTLLSGPFNLDNICLFHVLNGIKNTNMPLYLLLNKQNGEWVLNDEDDNPYSVLLTLPEGLQNTLKSRALIGKVFYNPKRVLDPPKIKRSKDKFGIEKYELNLYIPPMGLRNWDGEGEYSIPPLFEKFFSALFKYSQEKEIFLDKLSFILKKDKSQTHFLFITSTQGTGKSTTKNILQSIFGKYNCGILPNSFFEEKFNAILENKLFLFGDEISAKDAKQMDKLKNLIDDKVTTRKMYSDPTNSVGNHASFLFTSNHLNVFQISSSDRRFFVPDLTEAKLEKALKNEEIDYLKQLKDDSPEIIEFCRFLWHRKCTHDPDSKKIVYSDTYLKCIVESLSTGEKFLFDLIWEKKMNHLTIAELIKKYANSTLNKNLRGHHKTMSVPRVEEFVNTFKFCKRNGTPEPIAKFDIDVASGQKVLINLTLGRKE